MLSWYFQLIWRTFFELYRWYQCKYFHENFSQAVKIQKVGYNFYSFFSFIFSSFFERVF